MPDFFTVPPTRWIPCVNVGTKDKDQFVKLSACFSYDDCLIAIYSWAFNHQIEIEPETAGKINPERFAFKNAFGQFLAAYMRKYEPQFDEPPFPLTR